MSVPFKFSLEDMKKAADTRFAKTSESLTKQLTVLDDRLDGNSYGSLIGSIFFTLIWIAATVFGGALLKEQASETLCWVVLIPTLLLTVLMLLRKGLMLRYYGVLLSARNKLRRLREQVAEARSALSGDLEHWSACEANDWKAPVRAGENVIAETERVDAQLGSMKALSDGGLSKLLTGLYFISCVAWAIVAFYFCRDLGEGMLNALDFSAETDQVILVICAIVGVIVTVVLCRLVWAACGNQVRNVTLLGLLIGPVAFPALVAVVLLLVAVVQLVIGIAVVGVIGAVAYACLCGG